MMGLTRGFGDTLTNSAPNMYIRTGINRRRFHRKLLVRDLKALSWFPNIFTNFLSATEDLNSLFSLDQTVIASFSLYFVVFLVLDKMTLLIYLYKIVKSN